jgi:5'-nucleotidase
VTVTVPADLPAGTAELTLTSPASGTVVHVPFEVEASVPLVETTTRLTAILPIHINRLVPSTLVATVRQGDGARPDGSVVFREGDTVVATVKVRYGVATFTSAASRRARTTTQRPSYPPTPLRLRARRATRRACGSCSDRCRRRRSV